MHYVTAFKQNNNKQTCVCKHICTEKNSDRKSLITKKVGIEAVKEKYHPESKHSAAKPSLYQQCI